MAKIPSTADLVKALREYQLNCLNGEFFDPNNVAEKIAEHTMADDNAPPLAKFFCSFGDGGKGFMGVAAYWHFREQVQEFQVANNISSIYWRQVEWDNHVICFPDWNEQLRFMPQDKSVLKRWKPKVLNRFFNFAQSRDLEWYEEPDNIDEDLIFYSLDEIKKEAEKYDFATLGHWPVHPVRSGETNEILYWQQEYWLSLSDFPQFDRGEKCLTLSATARLAMPLL